MRPAQIKYIALLALGAAATIAIYLWFIQSSYFEAFTIWSHAHRGTLFVSIVALKVIGMVWPPFAGGVFTFGAIPIIGWLHAYSADLIGSAVGSSAAYWIARRWGMAFLVRLLDAHTIAKLVRVRIPRRRELEAIYLFRILGTGSVVEIICYGAGLLRVGFPSFLLASILSHMTVSLPLFYFGKEVFGRQTWTAALVFVVLLAAVFVLRKRYFREDEITSHAREDEP